MESINYENYNKRHYKPPTDIKAANKKLNVKKIELRKKRLKLQEKSQLNDASWDALESV